MELIEPSWCCVYTHTQTTIHFLDDTAYRDFVKRYGRQYWFRHSKYLYSQITSDFETIEDDAFTTLFATPKNTEEIVYRRWLNKHKNRLHRVDYKQTTPGPEVFKLDETRKHPDTTKLERMLARLGDDETEYDSWGSRERYAVDFTQPQSIHTQLYTGHTVVDPKLVLKYNDIWELCKDEQGYLQYDTNPEDVDLHYIRNIVFKHNSFDRRVDEGLFKWCQNTIDTWATMSAREIFDFCCKQGILLKFT